MRVLNGTGNSETKPQQTKLDRTEPNQPNSTDLKQAKPNQTKFARMKRDQVAESKTFAHLYSSALAASIGSKWLQFGASNSISLFLDTGSRLLRRFRVFVWSQQKRIEPASLLRCRQFMESSPLRVSSFGFVDPDICRAWMHQICGPKVTSCGPFQLVCRLIRL